MAAGDVSRTSDGLPLPLKLEDVPEYLTWFDYHAVDADQWADGIDADEGIPEIVFRVSGHQKLASATYYTILMTVCNRGKKEPFLKWECHRPLSLIRLHIHDFVKRELGADEYHKRFKGSPFAPRGGFSGTTARLDAWFRTLGFCASLGVFRPKVIADILRFLEAPMSAMLRDHVRCRIHSGAQATASSTTVVVDARDEGVPLDSSDSGETLNGGRDDENGDDNGDDSGDANAHQTLEHSTTENAASISTSPNDANGGPGNAADACERSSEHASAKNEPHPDEAETSSVANATNEKEPHDAESPASNTTKEELSTDAAGEQAKGADAEPTKEVDASGSSSVPPAQELVVPDAVSADAEGYGADAQNVSATSKFSPPDRPVADAGEAEEF